MDDIEKKFMNLYNSYSNDVLKFAFNFTKNIYEAEDIVQSVYIKLYKELKKSSQKDFNKKWLLIVTTNESKNIFKNVWHKRVILNDETLQNEIDLNTSLKEDELSKALLQLPLRYRNVIYLYYYDGYKIEEISEILKLNLSNVKSILSRGRKKLKNLLEDKNNEE